MKDDGFTLIEVLTVLVIIGLLAAIAVPIYLRQREKGWVVQSQSALRDAATAIESYGAANQGDYSGSDGACSPSKESPCPPGSDALFVQEGFRKASAVKVEVQANGERYCLTATHDQLYPGPPPHDWWVSTWNSDAPGPSDEDSCPGF